MKPIRPVDSAAAIQWAQRRSVPIGIANGVCKFSIDQFGKLKWGMPVPIAHQHPHCMATQLPNPSNGQVPPVAGPNTLGVEPLAELTDDRFDASPNLNERPGPLFLFRSGGGFQPNGFRQLNVQALAAVGHISQHCPRGVSGISTLWAAFQDFGSYGYVVLVGRSDSRAHHAAPGQATSTCPLNPYIVWSFVSLWPKVASASNNWQWEARIRRQIGIGKLSVMPICGATPRCRFQRRRSRRRRSMCSGRPQIGGLPGKSRQGTSSSFGNRS